MKQVKKKLQLLASIAVAAILVSACGTTVTSSQTNKTEETAIDIESTSKNTTAFEESISSFDTETTLETIIQTEETGVDRSETELLEAENNSEKETKTSEQRIKVTDADETKYTTTTLNVRRQASKESDKLGTLNPNTSVHVTGFCDNGWERIEYEGGIAYVFGDYLTEYAPSYIADKDSYPLTYKDDTASIMITREWYSNAWCYIAHLNFTDYKRFGTSCANGKYNNGTETTPAAADRLGAILCVNGCYSAPYLDYGVVRGGTVWNDKACNVPAVYNNNTGYFSSPEEAGVVGSDLSYLASNGLVSDTFCFGPAFLQYGSITCNDDSSRAQRTSIGTTGDPGELWIVVSDGRYNDGESAGLTFRECAQLLKDKGCTFAIPLDGGGSSTMVFNGKVLNACENNERAVVDFLYFR